MLLWNPVKFSKSRFCSSSQTDFAYLFRGFCLGGGGKQACRRPVVHTHSGALRLGDTPVFTAWHFVFLRAYSRRSGDHLCPKEHIVCLDLVGIAFPNSNNRCLFLQKIAWCDVQTIHRRHEPLEAKHRRE